MNEISSVVFDFDGTLVSKDTGYEFSKWLIQKSPIRIVSILLFFPLVWLLQTNSFTWRYGINIGYFIATFLQRESIFKLRSKFLVEYFNRKDVVVYKDGINELINHQKNSEPVAIISGCPHWLLFGAVKHLGIRDVTVIGSRAKLVFGSLVVDMYCYHENKILMAKKRLGYNKMANWVFR